MTVRVDSRYYFKGSLFEELQKFVWTSILFENFEELPVEPLLLIMMQQKVNYFEAIVEDSF